MLFSAGDRWRENLSGLELREGAVGHRILLESVYIECRGEMLILFVFGRNSIESNHRKMGL